MQGCIDMPGTGDEAVQLECQESPISATAPIAAGPAHQVEHGLQLGAAARRISPGFLAQANRRGGHGRRFAPRQPLQRSAEHTSELQSLMRISYADFSLKKKINH